MLYKLLAILTFQLISLLSLSYAKPVKIGNKYNTQPRKTGDLRQDILAIQKELTANTKKLLDIYTENPEELKPQKVIEAKRLWNLSREQYLAIQSNILDLSAQVGDSHFVLLMKSNLEKTILEIEILCRRIFLMSPLDLYARERQLRLGKLLNKRSFYSLSKSEPVSGSVLFLDMQRGYRAFYLRTKTTYLQAKDIFQNLINEYVDYYPAMLWLARTLFELNEVAEARDLMLKLMEVDPDLRVAKSLDSELLDSDELFLYKPKKELTKPLPKDLLPVPVPAKGPEIESVPYALVFTENTEEIVGLDSASVLMEWLGSNSFVGLFPPFESGLKRLDFGPLGDLHSGALEYLIHSRALIFHKGLSVEADSLREGADYLTIYDNFASMQYRRFDNYPKQRIFFVPANAEETGYRLRRKANDPISLFSVMESGYPYQDKLIKAIHLTLDSGDTVSYVLAKNEKGFQRYFNAKKTLNKQGLAIFTAPNLILQYVNNASLDASLIGEGNYIAYLKGVKKEGKWQKKSLYLPTVYLDINKKPLLLEPGPVFLVFYAQTVPVQEENN